MTALILYFVIGLGVAAIKGDILLNLTIDFHDIIHLVIEKVIIPLLPFHTFGIFAKVFVMII